MPTWLPALWWTPARHPRLWLQGDDGKGLVEDKDQWMSLVSWWLVVEHEDQGAGVHNPDKVEGWI